MGPEIFFPAAIPTPNHPAHSDSLVSYQHANISGYHGGVIEDCSLMEGNVRRCVSGLRRFEVTCLRIHGFGGLSRIDQ